MEALEPAHQTQACAEDLGACGIGFVLIDSAVEGGDEKSGARGFRLSLLVG